MSNRIRMVLLALATLAVLPGAWGVVQSLPAFGTAMSPYGEAINRLGPDLRHVANMVSAVNFDFRGFDTVGEEYMLLCAVAGAVLLLRGARGEDRTGHAGRIAGRPIEQRSDATILICRICGTFTLIFGAYVALHATATPGGGFQGGVVVASGLLMVYLGEGYERWRVLVRSPVLDACEGGGAILMVAAGLLPVALGRPFLENVLPLGTIKDMLSGGLMLLENAGVALAVAGGFTVLMVEFLEETRALAGEVEEGGDP
jgi:multicomponent Na+:H+ antiporter subunit B